MPDAALKWRFSRATGPGGQGVNTADSRVELVADLTELNGPDDAVGRVRAKLGDSIRIVAKAERSQLRNREDALERLASRLDAAARPRRARTPTKPSAAAERRRIETKRQRSKLKATRRPPPDEP
jgi:ribosome-associated protein